MEPLILLHGAIGASDQLMPLANALKAQYEVHTLDFSGHGNSPSNELFSIPLFANDVLSYMDQNGLETASIFGYSMGGYVALYLALHHPQRVKRIVTLATKFHWDEPTASKEVQMLDAEKIEAKLPKFATALNQRHGAQDWRSVLQKTATMMLAMGAHNPLISSGYGSIAHSCLLLLGDRDKMVTFDETRNVFQTLPNAQLAVLPATTHPIEQVDIDLLLFYVKRFVG